LKLLEEFHKCAERSKGKFLAVGWEEEGEEEENKEMEMIRLRNCWPSGRLSEINLSWRCTRNAALIHLNAGFIGMGVGYIFVC
jgi:hypothetical protein